MRHGKKPTLRQKIRMQNHRLNPDDWLVVKDTTKLFMIVHRESKNVKKFIKEESK